MAQGASPAAGDASVSKPPDCTHIFSRFSAPLMLAGSSIVLTCTATPSIKSMDAQLVHLVQLVLI
jgi:hypothetical protein